MRILNSTIHCTNAIRSLWPTPLARQWLQQYPDIFDQHDLRLTVNQPRNHFSEWFAAIHLFHRDGAHSLIGKYLFQNHRQKVARLASVLSVRELEILRKVCAECAVQPPDLFAFIPKTGRYWFAEVKGPGDRLKPKQVKSHAELARELGVPIEIISVKIRQGQPVAL
jgi:hypothetical protein